MKKFEIRCSNSVEKSDKKVRCSRFLCEISDESIKIPCPKCGSLLVITKDFNGKFKTVIIPKGSALIQGKNKKEAKNV